MDWQKVIDELEAKCDWIDRNRGPLGPAVDATIIGVLSGIGVALRAGLSSEAPSYPGQGTGEAYDRSGK